jgi:hypothetical protein
VATLYLENVLEELSKALGKRAREHRKLITAEAISPPECTIPTAAGGTPWHRAFLAQIGEMTSVAQGNFSSAERMIPGDRDR